MGTYYPNTVLMERGKVRKHNKNGKCEILAYIVLVEGGNGRKQNNNGICELVTTPQRGRTGREKKNGRIIVKGCYSPGRTEGNGRLRETGNLPAFNYARE